MGQAAGATAVIGSTGSGSGLVAKNYVAWQSLADVDPVSTSPIVMTFDALGHEGTACATLNADTKTIDVSVTGIFVVSFLGKFQWTGQALAVLDYLEAHLAFTCADANALANVPAPGFWVDQRAFDQANSGAGYFQLTTPPLALASGDSFQLSIAATVTPAASVAPTVPEGQSTIAIERLA